ncbi:conserved hypothetical protein [Talaromyces stipitatus ATCC 10500]|uniref:Uncharacterized protein n=1 Tax=Talaromyces stipitatus (strain ATCC 10500 / CBS 375.48 / QM 6759 / NRRL 1006) TaxID=441959 RepID=B8LUB4_TALSN|nr:uncharacterized protein TSTA_070920 [Talaromyces stipitatus ATCC 10500]EED23687.1 conserved hypothetical protein [Talaromyces stipitatus ATCC 10500]
MESDASRAINYVVKATENVLRAAGAVLSVTRVVLTSSVILAATPLLGVGGIVITQDTWNDLAAKTAWDENTPEDRRRFMICAASKVEDILTGWK